MRIVVGMSGGVDSAAAAAYLRDEGHEVIGATLHLWDYRAEGHRGRCCAPEDQHDARRVCDQLGIAHYTFDRRDLFRSMVVDRFVDDYLSGVTPSPCVRCNEHVKLGPLWNVARKLGAEAVATGHYARIDVEDDRVTLRAATDATKDQSYFLFVAPRDALRVLRLPLGTRTKDEVREYMRGLGLKIASKPDSTDLCFVEGTDYSEWVDRNAGRPLPSHGVIETPDGEVVGTHEGVHRFTVGQRRGIGAVDGRPRYVLRIVPERDVVVVGTDDEARTDRVTVREFRWLGPPSVGPLRARLRFRHTGVEARVEQIAEAEVVLELAEPQRGVAPGQAAVLYDGDRVAGGGFIA